jgi:tRNA threonylcarbamoyl adenosine modification protein (Sua5/YciO/YrdC/YwlC family)
MIIRIHPENPTPRLMETAATTLQEGGLVIYPTDSVYAIGCSMLKPKAIDRLARLRGVKPEKARFSFIFSDLTDLSLYTKPITNPVFKLIRRVTPGPYTFVLEANNKIPKLVQSNRRTIGIRIPDNNIARELVRLLGHPMMSTSVHDDDDIIEYTTDPELIYEKYQNDVDLVIHGGYGDNHPTTVVDCTGDEIEVLRQGKGVL